MQIFDDDKQFTKDVNYLADDNQTLQFGDKKITLGEYRKLEKQFSDTFEENKRDVMVIWDETMQFTTIGLLDLLYEEYELDVTFDAESYFFRNNDLLNTVDYVIYDMKKHGVVLTEEQVKSFHKEHYADVIRRAPMSSTYISTMKCTPVYNSLTFVFTYQFEGMTEFVRSVRDIFDKSLKTSYISLDKFNDSIPYMLKQYGKYYSYFIVLDMANVVEFVIENKIKNVAIMGPLFHNGLGTLMQSVFNFTLKDPTRGPYNSELIYYYEGVVNETPKTV